VLCCDAATGTRNARPRSPAQLVFMRIVLSFVLLMLSFAQPVVLVFLTAIANYAHL
jgi:hypothetical protein